VFAAYLKDLRALVYSEKALDKETLVALLDIAEGGWSLMNAGNDRMAGNARGEIQAGFRSLDKTKKAERAKL